MRKSTFLLPAILFSSIAFCQESSKLKLGAYFSTNYSYRTLLSNAEVASSLLIESRNQLEVGKFGYNFGLDIQAQVSNELSISLGVEYQSRGFTFYGDLNFENDNITHVALPYQNTNRITFNYLSIPVNIKYQVLNKTIKLFPFIGVKYNMKLNANIDNVELNTNIGLSKIIQNNFTGIIGADIEYTLTEQLSIRLSPFFQHDLNRISKTDHPIDEYLWDIGCQIGASYSI